MADVVQRSQPLSIPNLLTYARIAAVPVVAALLFFETGPAAWWWAFGIYALAALSDYLDGVLARFWNQQSALGRMLDPIADKLLVGIILLMLVAKQIIAGWSIWAAIVILSREILVSGLREFLAELDVKVLVTRLAKWKTVLQLVAIGTLLLSPVGGAHLPGLETAGLVLLWAAASITAYTGYEYLRAALNHASPPS